MGWVRVVPGLHPAALVEFFELWEQADAKHKQALLLSALIGGLSEQGKPVAAVEDAATRALLDDMLADF